MSILLATTILALGGLGFYMYKSSDDKRGGGDEEYNEDNLFGSSSFFDWGKNDSEVEDEKNYDDYEDDYKPRKRGGKTQRNKRTNGNSKRRY
jgi:hypothetical protein